MATWECYSHSKKVNAKQCKLYVWANKEGDGVLVSLSARCIVDCVV